jgi:hypothetical protein
MMTHSCRRQAPQRGAALIEMMISTTIMVLTGGIVFTILNIGMILFAKNTAINVAHQQARVAVLQMEYDLHSSVSIPQLVDAAKAPVAGNGPAAGISCQLYAKGPLKIAAAASAGQKWVTVNTYGYAPKVGQRLCIPTHQIEMDIDEITVEGVNRKLRLRSNLPVDVKVRLYDPADNTEKDVNVVCFITDRIYYIVNAQGELRYFSPTQPAEGRLMANDITAATPFSIPLTDAGAQYNRFVAAINLSTADHTTTNRGFKAANMFLNAMVPYRARLCITQ